MRIRKSADIAKYAMMFLVLTAVGFIYDKYKRKYDGDEDLSKYHLVKKFLLNEDPELGNMSGKPTLWVHSEYNINAKNWKTFYSRNSGNLNQKYAEMCIESVVKYWKNEPVVKKATEKAKKVVKDVVDTGEDIVKFIKDKTRPKCKIKEIVRPAK